MLVDKGKIYDQLMKLSVELDFEQIATPTYLQEKIIDCNDSMRVVEKSMIEITRELSSKEKDLKVEKMRLEVRRRTLLVNDPQIKKLPTGKEREAATDETLQKDHETILVLENDVLELQHLLSSIKLVNQNLKTTNSDIRTLMRIMEQQITRLNVGTKDDKEIKDLVSSLDEVEQIEDEMTLDDVESSSQFIDEDEPDGRSNVAPQNETGTDANEAGSESKDEGLDSISSYLTDDSDDIGGEQTASEEYGQEEENGGDPAQSAVDNEGAQNNSTPSSTEVVGENDGGGVSVTDLDIDLGDMLDDGEPASQSIQQPKTVDKSPVEGQGAGSSPTVIDKGEPKKGSEEVELDIDDILSSLPD